eukprot:758358-Prorocentrum_minimum.AAC.1
MMPPVSSTMHTGDLTWEARMPLLAAAPYQASVDDTRVTVDDTGVRVTDLGGMDAAARRSTLPADDGSRVAGGLGPDGGSDGSHGRPRSRGCSVQAGCGGKRGGHEREDPSRPPVYPCVYLLYTHVGRLSILFNHRTPIGTCIPTIDTLRLVTWHICRNSVYPHIRRIATVDVKGYCVDVKGYNGRL